MHYVVKILFYLSNSCHSAAGKYKIRAIDHITTNTSYMEEAIVMTVMDKINSQTRTVMNMVFDQEPLNYLEAAGLYGIVAQGRFNIALLQVMYNHTNDSELKALIKEAIDHHTEMTIEEAEDKLVDSNGHSPSIHFVTRNLHNSPVNIPDDARMSDQEIAIAVGTMAKASQITLLTGLHNCYQPDVAQLYRQALDHGLDFDYRLLQLMLKRGWLPHLTKISH